MDVAEYTMGSIPELKKPETSLVSSQSQIRVHTIKGNGHGGVRYPRGFGVLTAAQKKNILLVLEAKQLCILEGG